MSSSRSEGAIGGLPMLVLSACSSLGGITPLAAATFVVTEEGDAAGACHAECSLRQALLAANASPGRDAIELPAGTFRLTLEGGDDTAIAGDLDIADDVDIGGAGGGNTVVVALHADRVLHVLAGVSATIERLTITGGGGPVFAGDGAGILNEGDLTLAGVVITGNQLPENGGRGAGIYNAGTLVIRGSTLLHNFADLPGGGVFNAGTARIEFSTLIRNSALVAGGGIFNTGQLTMLASTVGENGVEHAGGGIFNEGDLTLESCTVADNGTATTSGGHLGGGLAGPGITHLRGSVIARNFAGGDADCATRIESRGHNFIGDVSGCDIVLRPSDRTGDPRLGSLADIDVPGAAHYPVLSPGPLVDGGDAAACPAEDQLGQARRDGDGDGLTVCDIGAVELGAGCAGEWVVEAGGKGSRFDGSWRLSDAPAPHGGSSYWIRAAPTRAFAAIFEARVPQGTYEVFEWHTRWATRATAVRHLIPHATGATQVRVDQSVGGGSWSSLGTYAFGARQPGLEALASVTILAEDTVLSTNADAIRFVCRSLERPRAVIDSIYPLPAHEGEEVCFEGHGESASPIVALEWQSSIQRTLSGSAGFCSSALLPGLHTISLRVRDATGLWSDAAVELLPVEARACAVDLVLEAGGPDTAAFGSWRPSDAPEHHAGGSWWSRYKGSGPVPSYTFRADLSPGTYEVLEWHTRWASRSRRVNHMIQHAAGSSSVLVDQSTGGGEWTSLGIYTFSGPSSVMIFATDPIGSTNADAIRWRCRD